MRWAGGGGADFFSYSKGIKISGELVDQYKPCKVTRRMSSLEGVVVLLRRYWMRSFCEKDIYCHLPTVRTVLTICFGKKCKQFHKTRPLFRNQFFPNESRNSRYSMEPEDLAPRSQGPINRSYPHHGKFGPQNPVLFL